MALVSMSSHSLAGAVRLLKRYSRSIARIAVAVAAAAMVCWCVAAAATIPTVISGNHTLVAVAPLLQQLQLGYVISGSSLDVNGKHYPQPLVQHDGMDMADAAMLARFLHLDLTKKNGVLVFSSRQSPDTSEAAPPAQADLDSLRQRLLDALNDHRRLLGREPLHFDPIAEQAAQFQA